MLMEKMGVRAISRVTGHTTVTIGRVIDDIMLHAMEFNSLMKKRAKVGDTELDAMWTFVKKNRKKLTRMQEAAILKAMHTSIEA
ncbi:MAG: hypothetical protein AB1665_00385 [Candidatus Thermoplasmatota archaeon]